MPNRIGKEDVKDSDFVDAYELISDGYSANSIYLDTFAVSTTFATGTVVVTLASDGGGILYSIDHPVQQNDIVYIYGTTGGGGDGHYTVNTVLTDTSFTVNEPIGNSTDGYVQFRYPAGAKLVGYDNSNSCVITHDTVQGALDDLDAAICGGTGSLNPTEHAELRQLIHLADGVGGPYEGFPTGAYRVISPFGALFPTNITWYASNAMTAKIVQKDIAYTSFGQPQTIQWKVYDTNGITILATVTDTISYSGIFETSRLRSIVNAPMGGVLTIETHKTVRQLIHLADGVGGPFEDFPTGAYRVTIGTVFPTDIIWYSDITMTAKIVEKHIVYNGIKEPVSITWKVYDTDGVTVLATVADSISYTNNIFETSRLRSVS